MPKGYVIFTEVIHDPEAMERYAEKAGAARTKGGFRILAFDNSPEVLEREWHGTRTVILEFDSVDDAREWYRSPEYQEASEIRKAATEGNVVLVTGMDLPPA